MAREESADQARTMPPLGRFYDVAGRRLLLHRSGSGNPAVVFLAGGGAVGSDYLDVQRRAAQLTTSVLYDRGGTGWSERVKLPRTSAQVTDELRDLLRIAGVAAPYLLVGHSLGGLYARHYAQRFPDEVASLLLLDPAHEDYDAYMPEELNTLRKVHVPDPARPQTWTEAMLTSAKKKFYRMLILAMTGALRSALVRGLFLRLPPIRRIRELYRGLFAREMRDWPKEIREVLIERRVSLEWLWAGVLEVLNVEELYDEVRRAGPLPNVPLIVLCSTRTDEFKRAVSSGESEALLREELEGKRRLYETLAASVPRGETRLVDAGHFTLHFRGSDAVLQAIQDLLTR